MEHIAYCDAKAKELASLLNGTKTMLIRGAAGRKLPYGKVFAGETVYLLENDGSGMIKAKGLVSNVFNSDKLSPEQAAELVSANMDKLQLTKAQVERWAGKRYLCLIGLENVEPVEPFSYQREANMDDWIIVEDVTSIRK